MAQNMEEQQKLLFLSKRPVKYTTTFKKKSPFLCLGFTSPFPNQSGRTSNMLSTQ